MTKLSVQRDLSPEYYCPCCGDLLPKRRRYGNCHSCARWATEVFKKFNPFDFVKESYDWVRRLGGEVFE
jgi:hypothetical protein